MYICDLYDSELKYYCQRHSHNNAPSFTDQEIITIYVFAGYCQKYFEVKDKILPQKNIFLSGFHIKPLI